MSEGREHERKRKNEKKRENKTTGKVGEKKRGEKSSGVLFCSNGTKGYSMTGVGVR